MKRVTAIIILLAVLVVAGILALNYFKIVSVPALDLNTLSTPTVTTLTGPVILESIQNEAQLETISMEVANDQDVTRTWGVGGACRETLTYLGYFQITAGVNLQNIALADVKVDYRLNPLHPAITITLPPASIIHVILDTAHSRVVNDQVSIISQLCGTQLPDMVSQAQVETQQMATDTAIEEDILKNAQDRASFELQKLLLNMGYSNVTILYNSPTP